MRRKLEYLTYFICYILIISPMAFASFLAILFCSPFKWLYEWTEEHMLDMIETIHVKLKTIIVREFYEKL
jgi:hypothetical protein